MINKIVRLIQCFYQAEPESWRNRIFFFSFAVDCLRGKVNQKHFISSSKNCYHNFSCWRSCLISWSRDPSCLLSTPRRFERTIHPSRNPSRSRLMMIKLPQRCFVERSRDLINIFPFSSSNPDLLNYCRTQIQRWEQTRSLRNTPSTLIGNSCRFMYYLWALY